MSSDDPGLPSRTEGLRVKGCGALTEREFFCGGAGLGRGHSNAGSALEDGDHVDGWPARGSAK